MTTERLVELVRSVVGEPCWGVLASDHTDYVLVLDLGGRQRRSLRLANPRLSFLQRTYEGEFGFLIECCWRLDGPQGVVASCYDLISADGTPRKRGPRGGAMSAPVSTEEVDRLAGLRVLEDRAVTDVSVANAAFDLSITFEGGYVLRCLSTENDPKHKRTNWSFWSPDGQVTIGPGGRPVEPEPGAGIPRPVLPDEDVPVNLVDDE